ncbi:uncharacterized protein LOC129576024 [Sitodiplosis mosellana]|uniref:uncharacterized protein LOC129576024 n=1 Tax=Sitodiplosis mosellana TaxID=263140 RepID=UPI002444D379|nr:uncharacterized protein LOC129576024 [Sitodiplosis mosellana]
MLLKFSLIFAIAVTFCYCDDHVYGIENAGQKLLWSKELFRHNLPHPKNHTLIFKYIGSELSPNITYAKFEVKNATSEGVIEVNTEKDKERTILAQLNIINGTNFHVIAKIYGPSVSLIDVGRLQKAAVGDQNTPKTVTVVYAHNSTQTRNRKVVLGHRQAGDKLIDFQTHNVTFSDRFPEAELQFHDKNKCITSVGFSFDSATAIAFVNSTFVGEHGLNVIVYDLNSPFFVANMSIYGYDTFDKPETFKSIVTKHKKNQMI